MSIELSRILQVYAELLDMGVELDSDPIAYGPKRLNNKTAEVRNMLSRCERIAMDVTESLHKCKRKLMLENTDFELQMDSLLATDPEVRAGRSTEERKALGNARLKEARIRIATLNAEIQDLESLVKAVKMKRSDLKDIQGRLRDQRNLCLDEIGLGSRWGSKVPDASKSVDLKPRLEFATNEDVSDVAEFVDALTQGETPEPIKAKAPETPAEPIVQSAEYKKTSTQDIDSMLDKVKLPEVSVGLSALEEVAEGLDLDSLFG